jgi:hypothetical protein
MRKTTVLACAVALASVALAGHGWAANVLTAVKVAKPPMLSAGAADPAWANAKSITIDLLGGANFKDGKTKGTVKAVYSGDMLYMLVQYDDETMSFRRFPYQKQADGSWKKLKDPNDKMGHDDNAYYEDKLAFIWNINNSIKGFNQQGCMVTCHAGEKGKPYGNKYTASAGELGDIWHVKRVRSIPVGQADDQYVDNTRYDAKKAPGAGRHGDKKTGGGYSNIKLVNGKPELMDKSATASNKGGTYWLKATDKAPFDDSKFKAGDEVASIMVSPFEGNRGDLASTMTWKDGKWTVVIARKLVTGDKHDVQFDNLDGTYHFGVAAFNNAQVRHAYQVIVNQLKFAK